jgi:hypothetical protein
MIRSGKSPSYYNIDPEVKESGIIIAGLLQTYANLFMACRNNEDIMKHYIKLINSLYDTVNPHKM